MNPMTVDATDLTKQEMAVLEYMAQSIEDGETPTMSDLLAKFKWVGYEEMYALINSSLYAKGYIDFRLDAVPSLVILKRPATK